MLKQVIEAFDAVDDPRVDGERIRVALKERKLTDIDVTRVDGEKGSTDFVKIRVPGTEGMGQGGTAPTLGIIGRLGGVGARPERIGAVSDADGAVVAIACAFKLAEMQARGDSLRGDVVIATHICPDAPTEPHEPVPFMGSPVDIEVMNSYEVDPEMDAILSVDTTKGNRVINVRGIAITPTVKEGYLLRVSEDLLTDSKSNRQPSTNAGGQGGEHAVGRCLSPLRHMVISIALPCEVMNKRILEKLVRPPRDTTASGT